MMSLKMWKKDTKTGTRLTEFDIEEKTSGLLAFDIDPNYAIGVNIKNWMASGGTAIKHKDGRADATLEQLKDIYEIQ